MYHGERFNAYSHLAGSMLAVAALVLMTVKANGPYQLASALTYGICLILLYLGSTLYHSIPQPKIKAILQKVDHCMIYLLIAGSYTPFTLIPLKGGWGVVIVRRILGLGTLRHYSRTDYRQEKRKTAVLHDDLRHYGLADFGCRIAIGTHPSLCRTVLASVGRYFIQRRHLLVR